MDIFEGVKSDVMYTPKYAEKYGIWITYLGTSEIRGQDELEAEHKAPIIVKKYTK